MFSESFSFSSSDSSSSDVSSSISLSLVSSKEFLELARKERQAGNRTLLDVLGGETALINAQADAIAAKIEVLINSYTLLSLMGGLTLDSVEIVER